MHDSLALDVVMVTRLDRLAQDDEYPRRKPKIGVQMTDPPMTIPRIEEYNSKALKSTWSLPKRAIAGGR
jgi:hypothetical protein